MSKKVSFGYKQVEVKDKEGMVAEVFTSVHKNYDLMNDLMSAGMHRIWKRILIEISEISEGDTVLDIASGTGDIPKIISDQLDDIDIFMGDINYEMLSLGRDRAIDENFHSKTSFFQLSGENLPFIDESFNLITIGCGLRNFTNKENGLKEMHRCLKENSKLLILEFSKPTNSALSQIYDWYSFNILPKLGELFANDSESYKYLAESIRMHPAQEDLKKMIIESGFKDCNYYNLLNGIVAIHVASK